MNSLPIDLIDEIFSRLPVKSIGRCRCVSKLWRSILCRPDFTDLFLIRSSARPRLLVAIQGDRDYAWLFYSSPEPHIPCEKSSLFADFQWKLPGDMRLHFCARASGLFCFSHTWISKEKYEYTEHVIYNPSIRQFGFLPKLRMYRNSKSLLGFDPIDKIFKVLSMAAFCGDGHEILSLGTGKMSWRKIQCPLIHHPYTHGICINGILYYVAELPRESDETSYVIVCFDVRSEKFKFIHEGFIDGLRWRTPPLIKYKGKLGVTNISNNGLCLWVLEDIEKQEWSKYAYTFPDKRLAYQYVYVSGVTATGEIVLSDYCTENHTYVYYFNPESNTLHSVKIQVMFGINRAYTFVDYADDLTFNMEAHQQQDRPRFEDINKFDALNLLDDV